MSIDNGRTERLRQLELVQKTDAEWQTRAARHGFLRRFEREADLENELGEEERRDRALELRRAYMRDLAAKSAAVRKERADRMGRQSARRGGTNTAGAATGRRRVSGHRVGQDGAMWASRRMSSKLVGRWRITDMDLWDQDAVDLMGSAIIEINADGTGMMRFIAVEADLDHRSAQRDSRPAIQFTWDGNDEGTLVNGRGWIALADAATIEGQIWFHMGDDSGFVARRMLSLT